MNLQATNIYIAHGITGFEVQEKSISDLLGKKHQLKFEYVTGQRKNISSNGLGKYEIK